MNIYSILVILLIALLFIFINDKESYIRYSFILLFIVMGLRKAEVIGVDTTQSYYQTFLEIHDHPVTPSLNGNFLFYSWMKFVSRISFGNYQWFIFLTSAFVMYSYARLFRKYSKNPSLSVFWFLGMLFYPFMFSALKQSIAMAILTYSFDFLVQKKWKLTVLTVVIAALFHFPALVFLMILVSWNTRHRRGYLVFLAFVLLATFFTRTQLLSFMNSLYYGSEKIYSNDVKFLATKVIMMILIVVFATMLQPDVSGNSVYSILLRLMGIAIVFQTFCYYSNIFERLADYTFQFSTLLISNMFENADERYQVNDTSSLIFQTRRAYVLVIVLFSAWRFLDYVNASWSNLSPYYFFWQ